MVLSNKKLKQKLRAESAQKPNGVAVVVVHAPHSSSSSTSFKQLLYTASHKPSLSKRDVLRKLRSLQPPPEPAPNDERGGNKGNGTEDLGNKKNKKRKDIEAKDVDAEESKKQKLNKAKSKKQKQNKAKLKKQKQNKAKLKKQKLDKETENSSNHQVEMLQEATGLTKTNPSTSQEENAAVPTKVYVGGIPYYSTEDDIRSYFESCGTITEVDCFSFPDTGKFRGIALISFKTEEAAKRALALDGADMGGLFLTIQPYKTRPSKSTGFALETVEGYNRIYVGNLSGDIKEGELRKFFSNCSIKSLRFGMDKETGEFKGYAHVDFNDSQSLKTALTLDQCVLLGRPARVSHAVPLKNLKKNPDEEPNSNGNTKMKNRSCFNCNEKGHFDSQCPKKIHAVPLTNLEEKPDEEPNSNGNTKMKNRRCFNCNEKGHFDSQCPKKIHAVPLTNLEEKPDEEPNSNGNTKMKNRRCFNCNEKGHYDSQCPKKIHAVPLTNLEEIQYEEPNSNGNSKMKNKRCYNFHEKGHLGSECPNKIHAVPLMNLEEKPDEDRAVPVNNLEEKPVEEAPSTTGNSKMKSRKCYNCREKGHLDSECPKKQSSLM